jgi:molybdopterin-guanine dinucleotide biosynthesis protein A
MISKSITGIILAGGKSRRMGTEKGLLKLGDKHMIEYAIEVLKKVCDQILLIENSNAYHFLGYSVYPDIFPNSGPMGGIYTGLVNSKNNLNLVLSCDMPFIKPELLIDLIANSEDKDIVVPWHGGHKFEPMCALYHKNVKSLLLQFIQEKNFKIPDTFELLKTKKFHIEESLPYYSSELFFNVNSKEEFSILQKRF